MSTPAAPRENDDSQKILKGLARKIAVAIKQLPDELNVENYGGDLCVTVNKSEVQEGGLPYNDHKNGACTTEPAYTYSVSIKTEQKVDIVTITYTDPSIVISGGVRTRDIPEHLMIEVATGDQKEKLFSLNDTDTIQTLPKTTPDDVEIVLSFLEKAVVQHQESERKRADDVNRQQEKTATAVRAQLDRLA